MGGKKKKQKKVQPEQYVVNPLKNMMRDYHVYVMTKKERVLNSIIAFLVGGIGGLVFYGGLFKEEGEATAMTAVSNCVVFVLVGIIAVRIFLPIRSDQLTDYKLKLYYMFRSVGISYDEISPLIAEGYYAVGKNGLLGLLNKNGETVVDITHEGYCAVGTGGTICCVLSEEEAAVYDKGFTMIRRFSGPIKTAFGYSDGMIPVLLEGREDWCYLDDSGKEAAGGFLTAGMFQNGRAAVQYSDGTWGFIDTTGAPVGSERYEEIRLDSFGRWCSASRCVLKKNEKWHLCAENGSEIGSIAADDMDICCGEAVAYAVNGKWGFLSVNGETVIEPSYEAAHSFSGNVAAVCENGLWGFINRNNTLVVDYQFGNAGYFSNVGTGATCPVFIDQMWKLIAWKLER